MRWGGAGGPDALVDSDAHHVALADESARLLSFFEVPDGVERFAWRRTDGTIDPSQPLALYGVARLVHCFGIAHLLGHPRAGDWAEEGTRMLLDGFVDPDVLGFAEAIDVHGQTIADDRTTYGHAFALLAGATGQQAGIPGAEDVFRRATEAIDTWLWRTDVGAAVDAVDRDGRVREQYRGQNANMHLTEAFLAAYEYDGEREWLEKARGIANRLVLGPAEEHSGRIPEHYSSEWVVDIEYARDTPLDRFRPFGTMPGHAVEWARLLLNIAAYTDDDSRLLGCAKQLFAGALRDGRTDGIAGIAYTVDLDGRVVSDARMHWVAAEALGAAAWLARATGETAYADHYAGFWNDIVMHFADPHAGSWWHELDARNAPEATTWDGKPDLYHAYQATYAARLVRPCGIAAAAREGAIQPALPTTRS